MSDTSNDVSARGAQIALRQRVSNLLYRGECSTSYQEYNNHDNNREPAVPTSYSLPHLVRIQALALNCVCFTAKRMSVVEVSAVFCVRCGSLDKYGGQHNVECSTRVDCSHCSIQAELLERKAFLSDAKQTLLGARDALDGRPTRDKMAHDERTVGIINFSASLSLLARLADLPCTQRGHG